MKQSSERDDLFAQVTSDPSWATEAITHYRVQLDGMLRNEDALKESVRVLEAQKAEISEMILKADETGVAQRKSWEQKEDRFTVVIRVEREALAGGKEQ